MADHLYGPDCGSADLLPTPANTKARNFRCDDCAESYELKAGRSRLGRRVPDGDQGGVCEQTAASAA